MAATGGRRKEFLPEERPGDGRDIKVGARCHLRLLVTSPQQGEHIQDIQYINFNFFSFLSEWGNN